MIIEIKNISKSYFNNNSEIRQDVLNDISFSVKKGETLSIVGPSGSGKSTLLNILGTLDSPTSGIVKFNGEELTNYSNNQLAEIRNQKIGFIFQSHLLLPQLNLLENVLLPTIVIKDKTAQKQARERAKYLLETVNLIDKVNQLPSQLSGGECQRVAVVRALINKPDLILADEPTGSLDNFSAEKVGGLLYNINIEHKVALIVVTHSIKLANTIGNTHTLLGGKLVVE